MYSFEGEFRRRPQQNLSGASKTKTDRDSLIQQTQQQRQKREVGIVGKEHRKRLNSTIKIQAYVRSFLTRTRCKEHQRTNFDAAFPHSDDNNVDISHLLTRLLFFYHHTTDVTRLISMSQLLLKQWMRVFHSGGSLIQIRRMLALHLRLLNRHDHNQVALAVPLRMLEVFTSIAMAEKVMTQEQAITTIANTMLYLAQRGYFQEMRKLLDTKTPPLYGASPNAPTHMCSSLLELIQRPQQLIPHATIPNYGDIIMTEFAESFLCPTYTDAVQLYALPALAADTAHRFPFTTLVAALQDRSKFRSGELANTSWLLHAVLTLEPKHFVSEVERVSSPGESTNAMMLQYLRLVALLTINVCNKSIQYEYDDALSSQEYAQDNDSDSETEESPVCQRETAVLAQCVEMLNEQSSSVMLFCSQAQRRDYSPQFLESVAEMCHNLLLSHRTALHKYRILYTLAFRPALLRSLWHWMSTLSHESSYGGSCTPLLSALARGVGSEAGGVAVERLLAPLAVFCALFSLLIGTLHDTEFCRDDRDNGVITAPPQSTQAFKLSELAPLCRALRQVCLGLVELAYPESRPAVRDDYHAALAAPHQHDNHYPQRQTAVWAHLFKVSVHLLRQLYARDTRLQFCGVADWTAEGAGTEGVGALLAAVGGGVTTRPFRRAFRPAPQATRISHATDDGPPMTTKEIRTMTILREIPFVVSFSTRVLVFQGLIMKEKYDNHTELASLLHGPSINITVRRSHLYEDAFDKLSPENEPDMKLKLRVGLVNTAGADEAGVDGGGLFREFLSHLLKSAFDPNRGLFRLTADNMLFPNPGVHLLYDNFPRHYFFVGRMLGKALYENLLVELPLAEFFLGKLCSSREADVHSLASLDPDLYRGLLLLKTHKRQDVPDLGLDFTTLTSELGEQRIEELKPGGANIPVTAENRIEYIHLIADYKLNRQIRSQCAAFKRGLTSVVSAEWLRMFSSRELQLLISGAEVPVDLEDLQQHTNYSGGYSPTHPTIRSFWKVVQNFTDDQRRQLLKFVTSCSRPPLLGFKELDPPFCIQAAGASDRLPSASTCMNLLKLPEFESEAIMSEKLLYAVQSGAGFELS